MGEAFDNVHLGPGRAYFPAVSLGFGEHLTANFGNTPFRYPVSGYEPLQIYPIQAVERCNVILDWFYNLLNIEETHSQVSIFLLLAIYLWVENRTKINSI